MKGTYVLTSESVTEGHPDKVADQISDAIVDAMISQDPESRVACETLCTTGMVLIAGEVTTKAYVDIPEIARKTIKEIGYDSPTYGFDYNSVAVLTTIHEQSPDIAMGVDVTDSREEGAGDQGMMFGYACNETEELMPMTISLSHKLVRQLAKVRKDKTLDYLGPDGKSQVSVEYTDGKVNRVTAVVVSTQHTAEVNLEKIREDIIEHVITPIVGEYTDDETVIHVNPTGRFVKGGPAADTGLTGRKIIVDSYGGIGRHGGGAFSGKDPTKVDRSGVANARYIAKNIVAAGLADQCEVQVSYAIGIAEPTSFVVYTFGTGKYPDEMITKVARKIFPLKPGEIIEHLDLRKPIWKKSSVYGAFGRDGFPWEKTDKVEELKEALEE